MTIGRRVYRAELRRALGYSDSWYRVQQDRGVIPRGHRDEGGKREWFTEREAAAIIRKMNAAGTAGTAREPEAA